MGGKSEASRVSAIRLQGAKGSGKCKVFRPRLHIHVRTYILSFRLETCIRC